MGKNHFYHALSKHIDVHYHMENNANDMLTKVVIVEKFRKCLDLLHVAGTLIEVECLQHGGAKRTLKAKAMGLFAKVEFTLGI